MRTVHQRERDDAANPAADGRAEEGRRHQPVQPQRRYVHPPPQRLLRNQGLC